MDEFSAEMLNWIDGAQRFALARVVEVIGSAPLPVGATMVVGPGGQVYGGVSGGCVEATVIAAAQDAIADRKCRIGTFGVDGDDVFDTGLMCGGTIRVLVEPVDQQSHPWLAQALSAIDAGAPCAFWTEVPLEWSAEKEGEWLIERERSGCATGFVRGDDQETSPSVDVESSADADRITRDAQELVALARSELREYCVDANSEASEVSAFIHTFARAPQFIIIGAVELARALSRMAKQLGYETVVCDARPLFAQPQRFPDADRVVCQWPDRFLASTTLDARTVVCVLTHDSKFDVPALMAALDSDAGYIGAMGSRSTHLDRSARLRACGATTSDLERIHSPIGLDIGGRTAAQTAVSIVAEVIACANMKTGTSLGLADVPIH